MAGHCRQELHKLCCVPPVPKADASPPIKSGRWFVDARSGWKSAIQTYGLGPLQAPCTATPFIVHRNTVLWIQDRSETRASAMQAQKCDSFVCEGCSSACAVPVPAGHRSQGFREPGSTWSTRGFLPGASAAPAAWAYIRLSREPVSGMALPSFPSQQLGGRL